MHTPFPIFTIFLIFVVSTAAYRANLERKRMKRDADFWSREDAAKKTPKKDLSEIAYIHVPLDAFPIGILDSDEAAMTEEELKCLANLPILNLNDMTNTDIRLAYGTDNFDYMQSVGENFDRLEVLLCDYAKLLMENSLYAQSIPVLEFAVREHATISSIYTLLGECYDEAGEEEKLEKLIASVEERDLIMKGGILDYLRGLMV